MCFRITVASIKDDRLISEVTCRTMRTYSDEVKQTPRPTNDATKSDLVTYEDMQNDSWHSASDLNIDLSTTDNATSLLSIKPPSSSFSDNVDQVEFVSVLHLIIIVMMANRII